MTILNFEASFGDERKTVDVSQPEGGGEGYTVLANNRYQGSIFYRRGEWVTYDRVLTLDDAQILGEMVEQALNNKAAVKPL